MAVRRWLDERDRTSRFIERFVSSCAAGNQWDIYIPENIRTRLAESGRGQAIRVRRPETSGQRISRQWFGG
jgi:hypothetical protein